MSIYNFTASLKASELIDLSTYKGKVMLVVNTASQCSLTYQLEGLEKLHRQYSNKGLCVIGFPCNQFAQQDPENDDNIKLFCQQNYGVTFPIFSKIDVNGTNAHPLYKHMKEQARGFMWSKRIKWNFTKFLINHEGKVIKRYSPTTKPYKLINDIEESLTAIN